VAEVVCANGDAAKNRRPLWVGKKGRPMGRKTETGSPCKKAWFPYSPTPCSLAGGPGLLGGWWWAERCLAGRLLGQMDRFGVGKKARNGCKTGSARKSKANPLLNPLGLEQPEIFKGGKDTCECQGIKEAGNETRLEQARPTPAPRPHWGGGGD
jgi:hypothetical protein